MMNKIEKLETKIRDIEVLINDRTTTLKLERENIEYDLSLISLHSQLNDYRKELVSERRKRSSEVLELRLMGKPYEYGAIPLRTLSQIALHLSSTMYSTSQRLLKGGSKNENSRISKSIMNILDLKLAAIESGSTKLYIKGNNAPDLFGNSLFEDTLKSFFSILNAEDTESLCNYAQKIGTKSVLEIKKLLDTFASTDINIEMTWFNSTNEKFVWNANNEKISFLTTSIEKIKNLESEKIDMEAELITISLRGKFEIKHEDRFIKGTFPLGMTNRIKDLHIGSVYNFTILIEKIINISTGSEKKYYQIMDVR